MKVENLEKVRDLSDELDVVRTFQDIVGTGMPKCEAVNKVAVLVHKTYPRLKEMFIELLSKREDEILKELKAL